MKQLPASQKLLPLFLLPPVLSILASFIIYFPVIDRYFVSDDFIVLKRVCVDHIIFIKWFFRPISDMSIFMNYGLGGLNPIVFNAFNILIHGINVYLIYLICLNFGRRLDDKNNKPFAFVSAALFLCYPFHNEAVVWLLGRGASMACMFALLSVLSYYKIRKEALMTALVCSFYFISISAFETTIFFPLIFILILILEKENARSIKKWTILLILTFCSHMFLRYAVSGTILGNYGQDFFHSDIKVYLLNIGRVGGRLLFPPFPNPAMLTILFIISVLVAIYFAFKKSQKINSSEAGRMILWLTGMLIISCIIPVVIGVSTRTSETDRVLYFPSVFLCMISAILLLYCFKKTAFRLIAIVLIFAYNLFFLEKNNLNWIKASAITRSFMEKIKGQRNQSTSYFLNIPNEINGAFVFRMGFSDAILLWGEDSSRFVAVNYLPRLNFEKMNEKEKLDPEKSEIILPPDIILKSDSSGCKQIFDHGELKFTTIPGDKIYFWNIDQLDSVPACKLRNPR
ncbi:MAG TPA: hypothetical protein VGI38_09865 [Puia sp.]